MGYNYDVLYRELLSIPVSPSRVPKEEILAMLSALVLPQDIISRLSGLVEPYLALPEHVPGNGPPGSKVLV